MADSKKKGRLVFPPSTDVNSLYPQVNIDVKAMRKAAEAIARAFNNYNKPKVIFNPPATILYYKGNKYVSKVHEEEFDEEKGLLMCLAKANGISHLELKRMIKNAKRPQEDKK